MVHPDGKPTSAVIPSKELNGGFERGARGGPWKREQRGRAGMEAIERARLKLEEWIHHLSHHMEDYQKLASELETLGKRESPSQIRQAVDLTSEHLKKALKALGG